MAASRYLWITAGGNGRWALVSKTNGRSGTDGDMVHAAYTLHAEDDDWGQAGTLVREVLDDAARTRLVNNIVGHLLDGVTEPVLLRAFLTAHGLPEDRIRLAWLGIALHTTPETPYHLEPEVALVSAGVDTDVLGIGYADLDKTLIDAVVRAHPRPDFKRQILQAFTNGMKDRPDTTFGTMNDDVLAHFIPGFVRGDFVEKIQNSDWR